ncbi:MAG: pyridoxamine 5'-phosphate oxidase [Cenarchaeum symbiont of Oopsacas minuta]|nr:pyridoxamine 5'-phosphate oxidase [Cenarchaeum symbiont of Oopsacas minuta]
MRILHASPGFGGALSEEQTIDFLTKSCRTLVLGTVDVLGHVNMHPVWYVYDNYRMYVETGKESLKVRNMRSNSSAYYCIDDDDPTKPYVGVRGKATTHIIEDIDIIRPMTIRIVTKYTGGTDNKIAKFILDGVNDGGSVLVEISPSYYSTWDHSTV